MHVEKTAGDGAPTVRSSLSRGEFLKLSGAGVAGASLLGVTRPALGETTVRATDKGISPDNSPQKNRKNLIDALSGFGGTIIFDPGDYYIDNSGEYIVIRYFNGELVMRDGARLIFTDNTNRGLIFYRGKGARLRGVHTTFRELPTTRNSPMECIIIRESEDTVVRDVRINGSKAAGLLFGQCIRPRVIGARITNTMADGLHFANCQGARARRIYTENTGDDGLAFLNYGGDTPDYTGGYATDITVKGSGARGISVPGQRNVTIDGFRVEETSASGLYCAHEDSFNTRVPRNVVFKNGSVHNVGKVADPIGNQFGIEIHEVDSIEFSNVRVISPASRGVSSYLPNGGTATLKGVEVRGAPNDGFNLQQGTYYLYDLTTVGANTNGFYAANAALVKYGKLTSINSAQQYDLRRAFSFEKNDRVEGAELHVVDRQSQPTGYVVSTYGEQSGGLGRIYDRVESRDVRMQNQSGLSYRMPSRRLYDSSEEDSGGSGKSGDGGAGDRNNRQVRQTSKDKKPPKQQKNQRGNKPSSWRERMQRKLGDARERRQETLEKQQSQLEQMMDGEWWSR